jgi:RNA polymerase sigma-70 factor (ECF subfamily)
MQAPAPVDVAVPGDAAAALRMAAAARGDAIAFIVLGESYAPMLLGTALRILGDRNAAEAAVYGVLLEAWRSARSFDPLHFSVRIWWTIGVRTAALRALPEHRSTRMASLHDTQITTVDDRTEAADLGPLRSAVQSAMIDLDDDPRGMLQLAYFEGLGAAEIAARSESTADAVRYQVAEGLRKFAAALAGNKAPSGPVGAHERLAAAYLLGELAPDDAARFDLGEPLAGLQPTEVTALRDAIHGIALYTFPASPMPQMRARLLASITGPERLAPFADDLGALLSLEPNDTRELLARVDAPHGWRDDAAGLRILPIGTAAAEDRSAETLTDGTGDLDVTMVQRPAWPRDCLVRVAPGVAVPSRYPHSEARVLVLQGGLRRGDHEARPGDIVFWRPGTALGAAEIEGPELILAVSATVARRPGRR